MGKVVLAALVVIGCGEVYGPGNWPEDAPEEREAPPTAEEAITLVVNFYQEAGGVVIDTPAVWWSYPGKLGGQTVVKDGVCLSSRISWDGEKPLAETSLAHELFHCALLAMGFPDGDPGHIEAYDEWWAPDGMVETAKTLLGDL